MNKFLHWLTTFAVRIFTYIACRIDAPDLHKIPMQGPLIVIVNHTGQIEVPLLYGNLQPRLMTAWAKAETWEDNRFLNWVFNIWKIIPIRRGEADINALKGALRALEDGYIFGIAPEGTRNKTGILRRALPGTVIVALRSGVPILPVDSEHNAIHQCLHQRRLDEVRRLILTASGGPFREKARHALDAVTPADALSHPTWKMGRKITVDSATLMNKGLEVIEAHWLFGVDERRIDVVIHPQSVVHSLVEFVDGSIIAQLGVTDMRLPIQYAFSYPERWDGLLPRLDLARCRTLEFHEPDHDRFPCLGLAYRALSAGGSFPVVLNASNEVAVASFLEGSLGFTGIPRVIETVMDAFESGGPSDPADVAEIRHVDRWAHARASEAVRKVESKVRG